jgi:hypothetical protein
MTIIEEETNQSNVRTIDANEVLKGKMPLDELPEPYVTIVDSTRLDKLSKVINILSIKKGYRVVSLSISYASMGYVIMEKKKENNNKEK